jgi:hypothetical protein
LSVKSRQSNFILKNKKYNDNNNNVNHKNKKNNLLSYYKWRKGSFKVSTARVIRIMILLLTSV